MNDLTELFGLVLPASHLKNPRTGNVIKFDLKPHENKYLYFLSSNGTQYCYTPHKCNEGWYYSFIYAPQGPGSRTGKARHWKLKKLRCHRTRKAARARALANYQKGKKS